MFEHAAVWLLTYALHSTLLLALITAEQYLTEMRVEYSWLKIPTRVL